MRIINLDILPWEYDSESDMDLPAIDKLTGDLSDVFFITNKKTELPFYIFENLPLKKVVFDFNITIDYNNVNLDKLESTCNIILYDSNIKVDIIKCKKLESFTSTIEFKELECDNTDIKLTKIVNSENESVTSKGFIHTDNGVVLSKSKFNLKIRNIQPGLTIID